MDKEREELFEGMTDFLADLFHYPPLTSSIFAWLALDVEEKGATFKELQELTNASKSSVSNSLQVLVHNKHVDYSTKFGERTRIYRLSDKFTSQKMDKIREYLDAEKRLIDRFRNYALKCVPDAKCEVLEISEIYSKHIEKEIALIDETEKKLLEVSNKY